MMRSHRHTIMDGRVVTFALSFEDRGRSVLSGYDAQGPFDVSASRNAVIIHHAELHDDEDFVQFQHALDLASIEMQLLRRCNGRPQDENDGAPQEIKP